MPVTTSPDDTAVPPRPEQPPQQQQNQPDSAIAASLQTQPEHPDFVTVPLLHPRGDTPAARAAARLLRGARLLRMGPGVFDGVAHPDGHPWWVGHWFDGLSVIHEFSFSSSEPPTVRYRSRHLADHVARTARATPSWRFRELTFGPSSSGGHRRSAARKLADVALTLVAPATDPATGRPPQMNVSVLLQRVADRGLCVRTDGSVSLALDDRRDGTLNAGPFFSFEEVDERLAGTFAASHGGVDVNTGELFNFVYGLDNMDRNGHVTYTIFRLPCDTGISDDRSAVRRDGDDHDEDDQGKGATKKRSGSARVLTTYKAPPVYMHSVALTPTFVILMHWPLRLHPLRMLQERCVTRGMSFDAESPSSSSTVFRIVHRDTGTLMRSVVAPAAFAFHVVNAFDVAPAGGGHDGMPTEVCVDVCAFDDGMAIVDALELDHLRGATTPTDLPKSRLTRYTLPVQRPQQCDNDNDDGNPCEAGVRVLYDSYVELANIAPTATHEAGYRFVYGVAHDAAVFDSVVKLDVGTGEVVGRWGSRSEGVSPSDITVGEPVFVANEGEEGTETEEDDGVLLIVTTQRRRTLAVQGEEKETEEAGEAEGEWRSRLVVVCARTMETVASATIPYVVPLGFHGTLLPST